MKAIRTVLEESEQNFLQVYDCLVWYFGPNNTPTAVVLSFLVNLQYYRVQRADNRLESPNSFFLCTSPYIKQRLPYSKDAISRIMKRLKEEHFIDFHIYDQARYVRLNEAMFIAVAEGYREYLYAYCKYQRGIIDAIFDQEKRKPLVVEKYKENVLKLYNKYTRDNKPVYDSYNKYNNNYKEELEEDKKTKMESGDSILYPPRESLIENIDIPYNDEMYMEDISYSWIVDDKSAELSSLVERQENTERDRVVSN